MVRARTFIAASLLGTFCFLSRDGECTFLSSPSLVLKPTSLVTETRASVRTCCCHHPSYSYTLLKGTAVTADDGQLASPSNPWAKEDASLLRRSYRSDRVPSDIDFIVIGSGIGGLWLSACLSKFGYRCLVLEQHYTAGGLQHTFCRRGYEFVPGLHYIANLKLCQPLYEMVADPSVEIEYKKAGDSVSGDKGDCCSHDIKIGDLPLMYVREGVDNVRAELCRHFPDEANAIEKFLDIVEKAKWQAGQFATFKIFPRWLQFLTSQLLCSTYVKYASMTTEEALSDLTKDGRLKTVLSAFGGDLGENIEEGSFAMQAAVLGHVMEGCHYPEGGPVQFARGLVPTIRSAGGDVLVKARVDKITVENGRATGVRLSNGEIVRSRKGVVSDAGMQNTLKRLIPVHLVADGGPLSKLASHVERSSGGISHVFMFVGFNATNEELGLRSSSYYYIPCNASDQDLDASAIQDFYRDTLLDPNVEDVSAGIVFASAKDPKYSAISMPGKSTAIVFSEAKNEDFLALFDNEDDEDAALHDGILHGRRERPMRYKDAKELVQMKMLRSLLLNFPHLEPFIDIVEVGTPLTLAEYTLRTETLGLRHTPTRMCDMELRPDCAVPGLYFTGQDVAFAGWAGALTGAMVTAQCLLGYTLWDFVKKKTLMRDLGAGHIEDMIQQRVQEGTAQSLVEIVLEVMENAMRHLKRSIES